MVTSRAINQRIKNLEQRLVNTENILLKILDRVETIANRNETAQYSSESQNNFMEEVNLAEAQGINLVDFLKAKSKEMSKKWREEKKMARTSQPNKIKS